MFPTPFGAAPRQHQPIHSIRGTPHRRPVARRVVLIALFFQMRERIRTPRPLALFFAGRRGEAADPGRARSLVRRCRRPPHDSARRESRRRLQGAVPARRHQLSDRLRRSSLGVVRRPAVSAGGGGRASGAARAVGIQRRAAADDVGSSRACRGPGATTKNTWSTSRKCAGAAASTACMSSSISIRTSGAA